MGKNRKSPQKVKKSHQNVTNSQKSKKSQEMLSRFTPGIYIPCFGLLACLLNLFKPVDLSSVEWQQCDVTGRANLSELA